MPSTPEQHVELDLKNHRPTAGETRRFAQVKHYFSHRCQFRPGKSQWISAEVLLKSTTPIWTWVAAISPSLSKCD
jgi:hypothetical protein